MLRGWSTRMAVALTVAVTMGGGAAVACAQDATKLSDALIERLATSLARVADKASPRAVAYFTAEPAPAVKAYLEGQGVEVVVLSGAPVASAVPMPPASPTAAVPPSLFAPPPAAGPYGLVGMRVPDTKKVIEDFLLGVRQAAAALPPGSALTVDGFSVDLPGGSVFFRLQ